MLQEHKAINQRIREAAARGIFLVFLIIDAPSNRDSILQAQVNNSETFWMYFHLVILINSQSISFGPGGTVKTTPYLDTFPFPYYIVLREIHALPRVLADSLRQWFELLQRSETQV